MKAHADSRNFYFFDFDGTLSTIVKEKNDAKLHNACKKMLASLANDNKNIVAVLSSRRLDNLLERIAIKNVYMGGNCGLFWLTPDGTTLMPDLRCFVQLGKQRKLAEKLIAALYDFYGVEIEDKVWSVAIHTRKVNDAGIAALEAYFLEQSARYSLEIFKGERLYELMYIPGTDKSTGVKNLCEYLGFDREKDKIFYAGDDENDAQAMKHVQVNGGTAITVGDNISIKKALKTKNPGQLAKLLRGMKNGYAEKSNVCFST